MIRYLFLVLFGFGIGVQAAQSQSGPVLLELYTSQGCSSCPPADALLAQIDEEYEDVIAVALHVDYWDYIGWPDKHASPQFTKRQKNYARVAGRNMIYTPQMIIGGKTAIAGFRPDDVAAALDVARAKPQPFSLALDRADGVLTISLEALTDFDQPATVQLVRYTPLDRVAIKRGENAGRTIDYVNTVTSWEAVGQWSGEKAQEIQVPLEGDDPVVVLVQAKDYGAVLASSRLR